jgi:TonB family protein
MRVLVLFIATICAVSPCLADAPDKADAIEAACRALRDNPLAPENHIRLGQALQAKGDLGGAEAEYKAAQRLSVGKRNAEAERLIAALPAAKARAVMERVTTPTSQVTGIKNYAKPQDDLFGDVHDRNTPIVSGVPSVGKRLSATLPDASTGTISEEVNSSVSPSNAGSLPSIEAQKDVDYGPYMADLIRRVKRAWTPPKGEEDKVVAVRFKIGRGGQLSELKIEQSSGSPAADQAATKAVEQAAPFRQLPAGSKAPVEARIKFDYADVGGGGTLKSF